MRSRGPSQLSPEHRACPHMLSSLEDLLQSAESQFFFWAGKAAR
jgi:hypothetical protein